MDYDKTGKLIQELRKEKELTQMALADRLGVTDRAVSKWERGKSFPDVSMLKPLAEVLGVSVSELLDGERRPQDKVERLTDGAAAMAVKDADKAAIKGINTYIYETRKKDRVWIVAFFILVVIYIITVSWLCHERYSPVNFQEDSLEFSKIRMVLEDGSVEMIYFDGADGQELKSAIQDVLREEMPEPETMGRLEVLPRDSAQGAFMELDGLITVYSGVYYDRQSYEYYTFPDMGRVYERLLGLCGGA